VVPTVQPAQQCLEDRCTVLGRVRPVHAGHHAVPVTTQVAWAAQDRVATVEHDRDADRGQHREDPHDETGQPRRRQHPGRDQAADERDEDHARGDDRGGRALEVQELGDLGHGGAATVDVGVQGAVSSVHGSAL
jgi:hypothetical protein